VRVYLGLGSNLGDRWGYLRQAVESLLDVDPAMMVSPVYESAPVGGPEQGDYLNCVVRIDTDLDPPGLLALARRLEAGADRARTVKDGPRTLDVDVLLIEGVELTESELTVPHPRMAARAFVLAPLEDLDPALVPVGWRAQVPGASSSAAARRVGKLELNRS
jgi:2-amino-4-hydroxy-6-hydroxymethyldihydropteridine diphosphokinase